MNKFPSQFNLPAGVADALIAAAESMAADTHKAFRISRRGARGDTRVAPPGDSFLFHGRHAHA
jgi:hypothetical protein